MSDGTIKPRKYMTINLRSWQRLGPLAVMSQSMVLACSLPSHSVIACLIFTGATCKLFYEICKMEAALEMIVENMNANVGSPQ